MITVTQALPPVPRYPWCYGVPPFSMFLLRRAEKRRMGPVVREINEQLAARNADAVEHAWPEDFRADAYKIPKIIQHELGWVSSLYLPDDELRWVFLAHQDGLDDCAAQCVIEDTYNITISEEEVETLHHQTMLDLVMLVRAKRR